MADLQHFSHEHSLMFISEVQTQEGNEEKILCDGCQKPMSSSAYTCSECNYFLHEKCAQLPTEINHHKHYEHPLKLFSDPTSSSNYECDVCGVGDWKWFMYYCSVCEFVVHVECASDEDNVVEHESHPHPLTFVRKKSLFECDGCYEKMEDASLFCNTCQFWIHKSCASLPKNIEHGDHDHPLVLKYFFPYENRNFRYECDLCRRKVHVNKWIYGCDRCRYYAHIKCVTSEQPSRTGDVIADDPNTIIRFPLTIEGSIKLLSDTLNELSLPGAKLSLQIDNFSHEHLLVLFEDQTDIITKNNVLCDCCICPITSVPFYGCSPCGYYLHVSCSNLPIELQHPAHPEHLLDLCAPASFVHNFSCDSCQKWGNGFFYMCEPCSYHIGISCAFFPKIIKHEGHKHPMQIEWNNGTLCDTCDKKYEKSGFACNGCEFNVAISCSKLPTTIKHDWHEDPLTLSYPPYSDHPGAFFCEDCEIEIYPKAWVYRSSDRLNFYHTYCATPYDQYSETKFGGTVIVENHAHSLTFVRRSKNKSPSSCDTCGKDCKDIPVVECAPCNFVIARACCEDIM